MNFQQLRYVRETVRQGLNLTEAAKKLFTSQPGVSKQIRELENELGVEIFVRHGKRIVAVTEPGKAVVEVIERLLQEAENLKQVGREFKDQTAGTLTIATTHTQARYSLPKVVGAFKRRYPKVHLTIKQGNPPQLAEMVIAREADMAIATEALDNYPKLLALPGYEWRHCVVVPAKHPLAKEQRLTRPHPPHRPHLAPPFKVAGKTSPRHRQTGSMPQTTRRTTTVTIRSPYS